MSVGQTTKTHKSRCRKPDSYFLARRDEASGFGLRSLQALVASLAAPLLLQQRHTGAPHRDGDVDLGVRVTAADAGAGSLQDDGRSVDRSAAVLVALRTVRSDQAALTQAVSLGDVAGIPGRVVGDPGKQTNMNLEKFTGQIFEAVSCFMCSTCSHL